MGSRGNAPWSPPKSTRGHSMRERSTQSRERVKGGTPLQGAGTASLPVTLRSRRSPQAVLLTICTLSCQIGADDQHGRSFSFGAGLFHCRGIRIYPPSFSGKKFPKCAFSPCAKRKSMLQYARIEAFERAGGFPPVRENVFGDNPDDELFYHT